MVGRGRAMTGSRRRIRSTLFRISVPSHGGVTEVLQRVPRRSLSPSLLQTLSDVINSDVIMPVTVVPARRESRDASVGRASSNSREVVLKNLAEQLLSEDEVWVLKQSLQHFRITHSVPSLVTSLRPLVTNTERLMLLVELAAHMPSDPLTRDFQRLCTLNFPKYHTFLRYFNPHAPSDGSKVVAKDASGQYLVASKAGDVHYGPKINGTMTSEPRPDTTSVHGAESGFYSEHDDVSRHGNGRGSVSSPSGSAPSTLQRHPRPSLPAQTTPPSPRPSPAPSPTQSRSLAQRPASGKRPSLGLASGGPLKILSGSFQSLVHNRRTRRHSAEQIHAHSLLTGEGAGPGEGAQRRVLLARHKDGSLGLGIKGGKEYGTPITVCRVDTHSQQQGLAVGDRILDVNGNDFSLLTHAEAVTIMRNAWNIIMTVTSDGATDAADGGAVREEGGVELDILVYPTTAGKLGCAVHRDDDSGDITVSTLDNNSAAGKAGLAKGDTILQIDGMSVRCLTERQISTLTNSKRVRLKVRRQVSTPWTGDVSSGSRSRKDTAMSDDAFSTGLDLGPGDDDPASFAASTPRTPLGPPPARSRSEERVLEPREPGVWRAPTSPDLSSPPGRDSRAERVQRIYRPRTAAPPSSHHHHHNHHHHHHQGTSGDRPGSSGGQGSGARSNTMTRGRPPVRPAPSPRYTIVYSVRGRSADTIVHPAPHPAGTQSRNSKMRHVRQRSRSRDSRQAGTLTSADRDLLQAVQAGVEKRQRALRLSVYQLPGQEDVDWKI